MENLDLSHNLFKSLPIVVGNLELLKDTKQWEVGIGLFVNLIALKLDHNFFSIWPPQLERLTMLRSLDLSFNVIKTVPNLLGASGFLMSLNLSHNKLESIPTEIYKLPLKVSGD